MATYEIQGPDGLTYEIDGPDGATREQVIAAVKARHPNLAKAPATAQNASGGAKLAPVAPTPQPNAPEGSKLSDFKTGIGVSAIKSWLGLKQLLTDLTPEEQKVIELMEEDIKARSGWANAGEVVGDVAQFAIPGAKIAGGAAKAAKFLPKALQTAGTIAGTGAAASAAEEFLMNPVKENEGKYLNRAINAAKAGAIGAGVNSALGAGGKAATQMFKPTHEAKHMMELGVNPTLQQGAEGSTGRFIGALTSGMTDVETRQSKETIDAVMKRIMPNVDTSNYKSGDIYHAIDDAFKGPNGEYTKLFQGKKFTLSNVTRDRMTAIGNRLPTDDLRAYYQEIVQPILGTSRNTVTMGPDKMNKWYIQRLQDSIDGIRGTTVEDTTLRSALIKAKETFEKTVRNPSFSKTEREALSDIDRRYIDAKRMQDAIEAGKGETRSEVTPTRLINEYFKTNPKKAAAGDFSMQREVLDPIVETIGHAKAQDEARAAKNTLARVARLGLGAGAFALAPKVAAPVYGVSALGQTGPGARFLMGGNDWQKKMADIIRGYHPENYSAPVGGMLYDGE